MKYFKLIDITIDIILLILFTLSLIYDYFPNTPIENIISKNVLYSVTFSIFILSLLFSLLFKLIFKQDIKPNNLRTFKLRLFSIAYLLFLIAVLTVLGGQSSIEISFKSGVFWIVLFIFFAELFFDFKKIKQSEK